MRKIITVLVLWVCAVTCEPLRVAIQRRSERSGVYASDYSRGYRPYSYMAIPLHHPVPVMHVLSSAPLYRPNRGLERHMDQPRIYASSMSHSWFVPPPADEPQYLDSVESAPEILYARPKPGGGYVYSKKSFKRRAPVKPKEPMIIRIHKYRIVRD